LFSGAAERNLIMLIMHAPRELIATRARVIEARIKNNSLARAEWIFTPFVAERERQTECIQWGRSDFASNATRALIELIRRRRGD
jgi:hypothetical protein